jgi:CRISPR-associated protein Csy1
MSIYGPVDFIRGDFYLTFNPQEKTTVAPITTATMSTQQIRQTILSFLQDRFQSKAGELKPGQEEARQKLLEKYQPRTWIADAARRVWQIQQVSHALKFTHPEARGSSLSSTGNPNASPLEIGSHTLVENLPSDVVGNAAALDVYQFLRLEVDGQSLLKMAMAREPALAAALSDDAEEAEAWMAVFATLPEPNGPPSSHHLAKQLYWPLANGGYHLLAPLFSTVLVHSVWIGIRQDRFSEEAKAARQAHWGERPHPHGYREYPDLAIQKFGGTKPQNISQLNSERYGENWLLPSLPPVWQSDPVSPPLQMESVFSRRFGYRPKVRQLTRALRKFLQSVAKADSNLRIRSKRAELVDAIRDELFQFAAEIHDLDAGWSAQPACRLSEAEKCWLDPARAILDEEFAAQYRRGDWPAEICLRFGNWLNAAITTERTAMGQPEAEAWQGILDAELHLIRLELTDND